MCLAAMRAQEAADFQPSYVKNCINNPFRPPGAGFTLALWPKADPSDVTLAAAPCCSIRCSSPICQLVANRRDFAKVDDAFKRLDAPAHEFVFMVLTIDALGTLAARADGKTWGDADEMFGELSRNTRNLLSRFKRENERRGWRHFENRWVATVEIQQSGNPHLNLVIHWPDYAEHLRRNPSDDNRLAGQFLKHARATNWGTISTAEPARNAEALAGYIAKTAANLDRVTGEVSKLCQTPIRTRRKVRRIRAGKGFIRTREKGTTHQGIMLRRRLTYGGLMSEPIMRPDQVRKTGADLETYLAGAAASIRAHQRQIDEQASGGNERKLVRTEKPSKWEQQLRERIESDVKTTEKKDQSEPEHGNRACNQKPLRNADSEAIPGARRLEGEALKGASENGNGSNHFARLEGPQFGLSG